MFDCLFVKLLKEMDGICDKTVIDLAVCVLNVFIFFCDDDDGGLKN